MFVVEVGAVTHHDRVVYQLFGGEPLGGGDEPALVHLHRDASGCG